MEHNRQLIHSSGAKTLVTSCPICYKIFKEEYKLKIEVLHHSQYLLRLVKEGKLLIKPGNKKITYHEPCELGRGCGIYEEPRQLLASFAQLVPIEQEKENGLCCGGSIASIGTSKEQKDKVTIGALKQLYASQPDLIATACPLCKKTFSRFSQVQVADIAELVYDSLQNCKPSHAIFTEETILEKFNSPVEI
jgi:Fe-S oxidoreductase